MYTQAYMHTYSHEEHSHAQAQPCTSIDTHSPALGFSEGPAEKNRSTALSTFQFTASSMCSASFVDVLVMAQNVALASSF